MLLQHFGDHFIPARFTRHVVMEVGAPACLRGCRAIASRTSVRTTVAPSEANNAASARPARAPHRNQRNAPIELAHRSPNPGRIRGALEWRILARVSPRPPRHPLQDVVDHPAVRSMPHCNARAPASATVETIPTRGRTHRAKRGVFAGRRSGCANLEARRPYRSISPSGATLRYNQSWSLR